WGRRPTKRLAQKTRLSITTAGEVGGAGEIIEPEKVGPQVYKGGIKMNVLNQDPYLPIGVLNLTAKNEPTVIGQCPVCGRDIYEGEWVYRIDGDVVCTNRRCLVDRAPIDKYVGDFGYL